MSPESPALIHNVIHNVNVLDFKTAVEAAEYVESLPWSLDRNINPKQNKDGTVTLFITERENPPDPMKVWERWASQQPPIDYETIEGDK